MGIHNYSDRQRKALNNIIKKYFSCFFKKSGDSENISFPLDEFLNDMQNLSKVGIRDYDDTRAEWLDIGGKKGATLGKEPGVAVLLVINEAIREAGDALASIGNGEKDGAARHHYSSNKRFKTLVNNFLFGVANELVIKTSESGGTSGEEDGLERLNITIREYNEEIQVFLKALNNIQERTTKAEEKVAEIERSVKDRLDSMEKNVADAIRKADEKANDTIKKADDKVTAALNDVDSRVSVALNTANRRIKTALKKADEKVNDVIPNVLAALGIFVGIVVAIVACYLNIIIADMGGTGSSDAFALFMGVMTAQASASQPELIRLLQSVFVGQLTVNVVILLMYLLAKLTHRSVGTYCRKGQCSSCEECKRENRVNAKKGEQNNPKDQSGTTNAKEEDGKSAESKELNRDKSSRCTFIKRFWYRYSYAVAINLMFLIIYILFILAFACF